MQTVIYTIFFDDDEVNVFKKFNSLWYDEAIVYRFVSLLVRGSLILNC